MDKNAQLRVPKPVLHHIFQILLFLYSRILFCSRKSKEKKTPGTAFLSDLITPLLFIPLYQFLPKKKGILPFYTVICLFSFHRKYHYLFLFISRFPQYPELLPSPQVPESTYRLHKPASQHRCRCQARRIRTVPAAAQRNL